MPVFQLTDRISFPPPEFADNSGLLAIGGDLEAKRLLLAYRMGIFPWYDSSTPILWWSPNPRMVLTPQDLHISKSLKKVLKKDYFKVTLDLDFESVITECAFTRLDTGEETWITDEMINAYIKLYELGYAHSVEVWLNDKLVGGVYGVSIGKIFFGESMFTIVDNASKVGFVYLVKQLEKWNFDLIDCQVKTDNLKRFGAIEIARKDFLKYLNPQSILSSRYKGRWRFDNDLKVI